ncbi:MAG: aminotransferase class IV, partial [Thermaerobacterales bacterium]
RRNHLYEEGMKPTVVALARPADRPAPAVLSGGVDCITLPDTRWAFCQVKTTGLLPNIMARRQAHEAGAKDAIFIRDGFISEASASNVFCAFDGVVYTYPLANILPGITRGFAIGLLREMGIEVREEAVTLQQFRRADEIWMTGTVQEAAAVVNLDGKPVGDGRPGPITRRLQEAFDRLVPTADQR